MTHHKGMSWFCECDKGIRLYVYVTPKSRKDTVEHVQKEEDGRYVLKIRVKAVAENGKANQAVVKHMAKELGVASSQVTLLSGETSRRKVLLVKLDKAAIQEMLQRLWKLGDGT